MDDSRPLLDVAASLADGTAVDWDSAARSLDNDEDRLLLAELRFIAEMTSLSRGDASGVITPSSTWGPLKILEHVGRGSFGDVYRAWDTRLDRDVALKILRRTEDRHASLESTVIQEGRLLARVRHPNVATVYGAERLDGQVGVWMEFVQGKTLEQQLREDGPFDLDRVIRIGIEISGALTTVHRAGLIHRDVKAQNVLCDADGRLVLTDFGAGCELHETAAGTLAGTPTSVAPESLQGHTTTPQSDVYSLGVLLYHLATGTYPVIGRSLNDIREAHAQGRRTPLVRARPDLPDAFVRVVDRAIDPDPINRYESPETLRSELELLASPGAGDSGSAGRPPGSSVMSARGASGRWWTLLAAATLIAVVTLWFGIGSPTSPSLSPDEELTGVVTLTEQGRLEDAYQSALRARSAAPRSPVAANAVAYVLTYAGFLDDAARAIDDILAAAPDYMRENGWWTPTALLYQRDVGRFQETISSGTSSGRLYRALAEIERGQGERAVSVLAGIESGGTSVFSRLAAALDAALEGRNDAAASIVRSLRDERRMKGDTDGEVTFKQAQILSVAGDLPAALADLAETVNQGFVCVDCFESTVLLEPVRGLPEYQRVRARALARHLAFGRRFDLAPSDR